jgi:hypothetical protein
MLTCALRGCILVNRTTANVPSKSITPLRHTEESPVSRAGQTRFRLGDSLPRLDFVSSISVQCPRLLHKHFPPL